MMSSSLIKPWDRVLFVLLVALLSFGLLVLYSATQHDAQVVWRQTQRIVLGCLLGFLVAKQHPRTLYVAAPWLYGLGLLGLLCVFAFEPSKGAQRWIVLGSLRIQPSEWMKLATPLMLARFAHQAGYPLRGLHVVMALLLLAVPSLAIAKQPDLGTALLVLGSGLSVLYFAGVRLRWACSGLVLLAIACPLLWYFGLHDYQKDRIFTFLSPESDPHGRGYHIIQSMIAIGSGGLWGKGWGLGTQVHLDFLPEPHTDFIFAVLAEEFGCVGALVLFLGYGFLIARGLHIGQHSSSLFGRCLAGGLSLSLLLYVVINVGMVSGLVPVVGVPLPLVSYGGSALITLLISMGLLFGLKRHQRSSWHG